MNLGFAGTPSFAARILQALIDSRHEVRLVLTQPDRRAGRGRRLAQSAVRILAEAEGLALRTPNRIEHELTSLSGLDMLVVAAYGLLLPQAALDAPARGCVNVHASLLPRWRGAAPVERAIMAGDASTGVSIMRMDAGLDTGPLLLSRSIPIRDTDTGISLTADIADLGAGALLEALERFDALEPVAQNDAEATLAPKLEDADARIDWRRPARSIARQVRALVHRRTAYTTVGGERVLVLEAVPLRTTGAQGAAPKAGTVSKRRDGVAVACGEDALLLQTVRLSRGSGRAMSARDAANGYPQIFATGVCLDVAG
ncbi:MAG: methionyl-tRNA formyltransferase [Gammaproteobacteria bacterium]|nr:methionyl-tRNA formyltransferase [Gammaproteobacteria bacterium]